MQLEGVESVLVGSSAVLPVAGGWFLLLVRSGQHRPSWDDFPGLVVALSAGGAFLPNATPGR